MKKRWLLVLTSILMALTLCLGFAACGDTKDELSDAEIAQKAISSLKILYEGETSTAKDFEVLGKTKVGDNLYDVVWTATAKTEGITITDYVTIGETDSTTYKTKIAIVQGDVDIEYTLTASVTVGTTTEKIDFAKKIPAKAQIANDGSEAHPFTIADVLALGAELNNGEFYQKDGKNFYAHIQGIVVNPGEFKAAEGSYPDELQRVWLADDVDAEEDVQVKVQYILFNDVMPNPGDGSNPLSKGDEIVLLGFVEKYSDAMTIYYAKETSDGDTLYPELTKWNKIEKSDAEIVADAKAALTVSKTSFNAVEDIDLPATYAGTTVTWALKAASDYAEVKNGKFSIKSLPDAQTTVTLVATITKGEEHDTKEFEITVSPAPTMTFKAIETAAAGTYKFAMYSDNKKMTYYATGAMDSYYFATSENVADAADFVITQNGTANQYTITVNGKFLEFAPRSDGSQGVDIKMNDTQTEGKYWQWVDGIKNFVFESTYNKTGDADATDLYYFGTFGANTSMSGNYIGRIATKGDNGTYTATANTEGVSQWVAHFGTMVEATEPEPDVHDDEKYGSLTAPLSVEQALALAAEECVNSNDVTKQIVYMTGIVKANPIDKGSYYQNLTLVDLTNSAKEILVYTIDLEEGIAAPAQHDTVVIRGYIKYYNGTTMQFASNSGEYVYLLKNTRGESTITVEADGATVSELPTTNKAVNGTEVTFKVEAGQGKKISAVKVYDEVIEATEGTYKFTMNGDATIKVETVGEDEKVAEVIASISFAKGAYTTNKNTNQYTASIEATSGDFTWILDSFSNNDGAWDSIKTGRKTSSSADQAVVGKITTKAAMASVITKVSVTMGSVTAAGVNSFKLLISAKSDFTDANEVTITIEGDKTIEFEIPKDKQGKNLYYSIQVDCQAYGSKNGFVEVKAVTFMGYPSTAEEATAATAPVAILPGKQF